MEPRTAHSPRQAAAVNPSTSTRPMKSQDERAPQYTASYARWQQCTRKHDEVAPAPSSHNAAAQTTDTAPTSLTPRQQQQQAPRSQPDRSALGDRHWPRDALPAVAWVVILAFCAEPTALTLRAVSRSLNKIFLMQLSRAWGVCAHRVYSMSVPLRGAQAHEEDEKEDAENNNEGDSTAIAVPSTVYSPPDSTQHPADASATGALASTTSESRDQDAVSSDTVDGALSALAARIARVVFAVYGAAPRTLNFDLNELIALRASRLRRREAAWSLWTRKALRAYMRRLMASTHPQRQQRQQQPQAKSASSPTTQLLPPLSNEGIISCPSGRRLWDRVCRAQSSLETAVCEWLATAAEARRLHANLRRGLFNSTLLPIQPGGVFVPVILPSGMIVGTTDDFSLDVFAPCQSTLGNYGEGTLIAPKRDETADEARAREAAARRFRLYSMSRRYFRKEISHPMSPGIVFTVMYDPVQRALNVIHKSNNPVTVRLGRPDLTKALEYRLASPSVFAVTTRDHEDGRGGADEATSKKGKPEMRRCGTGKRSTTLEYVTGSHTVAAHAAYCRTVYGHVPRDYKATIPIPGVMESYIPRTNSRAAWITGIDSVELPRLLLHHLPEYSAMLQCGGPHTAAKRARASRSALDCEMICLSCYRGHPLVVRRWHHRAAQSTTAGNASQSPSLSDTDPTLSSRHELRYALALFSPSYDQIRAFNKETARHKMQQEKEQRRRKDGNTKGRDTRASKTPPPLFPKPTDVQWSQALGPSEAWVPWDTLRPLDLCVLESSVKDWIDGGKMHMEKYAGGASETAPTTRRGSAGHRDEGGEEEDESAVPERDRGQSDVEEVVGRDVQPDVSASTEQCEPEHDHVAHEDDDDTGTDAVGASAETRAELWRAHGRASGAASAVGVSLCNPLTREGTSADVVHRIYPPPHIRDGIDRDDTEVFVRVPRAHPLTAAVEVEDNLRVSVPRPPTLPPRLMASEGVPCFFRTVSSHVHASPVSCVASVSLDDQVAVHVVGGSEWQPHTVVIGTLYMSNISSVTILQAPIFTDFTPTHPTAPSTVTNTTTTATASATRATTQDRVPHPDSSTAAEGEATGQPRYARHSHATESRGSILIAVEVTGVSGSIVILRCTMRRVLSQRTFTATSVGRVYRLHTDDNDDSDDDRRDDTTPYDDQGAVVYCKTVYHLSDYYYFPTKEDGSDLTQLCRIGCNWMRAMVVPRPWLSAYRAVYNQREVRVAEKAAQQTRLRVVDDVIRVWLRQLRTADAQPLSSVHASIEARETRASRGEGTSVSFLQDGKNPQLSRAAPEQGQQTAHTTATTHTSSVTAQTPLSATESQRFDRLIQSELAQHQLSLSWNAESDGHPYFGAAVPFFLAASDGEAITEAPLWLHFKRTYTPLEKKVWPQITDRPYFCCVLAAQLVWGQENKKREEGENAEPMQQPVPESSTSVPTDHSRGLHDGHERSDGDDPTSQPGEAVQQTVPTVAGETESAGATRIHSTDAAGATAGADTAPSSPASSASESASHTTSPSEARYVYKPLMYLLGHITALTTSPDHSFFVAAGRDGQLVLIAPRVVKRSAEVSATSRPTAHTRRARQADAPQTHAAGRVDASGAQKPHEAAASTTKTAICTETPAVGASTTAEGESDSATDNENVATRTPLKVDADDEQDEDGTAFRGVKPDALARAEGFFPRQYKHTDVVEAAAYAVARRRQWNLIAERTQRRQGSVHHEVAGRAQASDALQNASALAGTEDEVGAISDLTCEQQEQIRYRAFQVDEIFGPLCRHDPCLQYVQSTFPCLTSERQRELLFALTVKDEEDMKRLPVSKASARTAASSLRSAGPSAEEQLDDRREESNEARASTDELKLCLPLYFTLLKPPLWRVDKTYAMIDDELSATGKDMLLPKLRTHAGMAEFVVDDEVRAGIFDSVCEETRIDATATSVRPQTLAEPEVTKRIAMSRPATYVVTIQLHGDWLMTTLSDAFDAVVYDISALDPDSAAASTNRSKKRREKAAQEKNMRRRGHQGDCEDSGEMLHLDDEQEDACVYPAAIPLYSIGYFTRLAATVSAYSTEHLGRRDRCYVTEMRSRRPLHFNRHRQRCYWKGGVLVICGAPLTTTGVVVYDFRGIFDLSETRRKKEMRVTAGEHARTCRVPIAPQDGEAEAVDMSEVPGRETFSAGDRTLEVQEPAVTLAAAPGYGAARDRLWSQPYGSPASCDEAPRARDEDIDRGDVQATLASLTRTEKKVSQVPTTLRDAHEIHLIRHTNDEQRINGNVSHRRSGRTRQSEHERRALFFRAQRLLLQQHAQARQRCDAVDVSRSARRLRNLWAVHYGEEDVEVVRRRQIALAARDHARSASSNEHERDAEAAFRAVVAAASPNMFPPVCHFQSFKSNYWFTFWVSNMMVPAILLSVVCVFLLTLNVDNDQYTLPFWGIFILWTPVAAVFVLFTCRALDSRLQVGTSVPSLLLTLSSVVLYTVVFPFLSALKWDDVGHAHAHTNAIVPGGPADTAHFRMSWLAVLSVPLGAHVLSMVNALVFTRFYVAMFVHLMCIVFWVLVGCFFDRVTTRMPLEVIIIPAFFATWCYVSEFRLFTRNVFGTVMFLLTAIVCLIPLILFAVQFADYWDWRYRKVATSKPQLIASSFVLIFSLSLFMVFELTVTIEHLKWYKRGSASMI